MSIEKGVIAAIAVVAVGIVGYKVIQKKRASGLLSGAKKTVGGIGGGLGKFFDDATDSFRKGYESA